MEIEQSMGNTKASKAWKILKTMRVQNKDTAGINLICVDEWRKYYQDLLTEDRNQFLQTETNASDNEEYEDVMVTKEEVRRAINSMKNGKAPGPGSISAELVKLAPTMLFEILAKIFSKCIKGDEVPYEWKKVHNYIHL